jgi:hypothetical protein
LREHEEPELRAGERSLLVEDDPIQIFFEGNSSFLVDRKARALPIFHRSPFQIEVLCRSSAGMMVPAIGEQYAADIH